MVAWMTSSEVTGRSQSSCGHPGVVGDGATRLVEPDPRLPGKPGCGQRRGERRFGRPIARAKARLANPARAPGRYGGVGDLPPKRPRTTATASRRPVIYTPAARSTSAPAASCTPAGSAPRRHLRKPPAKAAGGRPHPLRGVPYTRPVKTLSGFRYGTLVSRPLQSGTEPPIRRRAPGSARTRCWPTRRRCAQSKARPTHRAPTADFRPVDSLHFPHLSSSRCGNATSG
jgi:hypothetical protein